MEQFPLRYVLTRVMSATQIKGSLTMILEECNETSKSVPPEDKHQQTVVLAKFLKQLAWLHPGVHGNGRFRALLLHREIRHRGIGRVALMFNSNYDVYLITDEVYVAKMEEGIEMGDLAFKTDENPWIHSKHKKAHLKKVPRPDVKVKRRADTGVI